MKQCSKALAGGVGGGAGSVLETHLTEQIQPLTFKTGDTAIAVFWGPAAERARRVAVPLQKEEEAWFSVLI